MSRAVMTAFFLYSGVAVFAAYEARVIASRAERNTPVAPATPVADPQPSVPAGLDQPSVLATSDSIPAAARWAADSARAAATSGSRLPHSRREGDAPRGAEAAALSGGR